MGLPVDEVTLQLPAAEWQPVNERMIPTGPVRSVAGTDYDFRTPRQVGPTVLDTAFTGLRFDEAGGSWTVLSAGEPVRRLRADDSHPWLQVFSPISRPGTPPPSGCRTDDLPAQWLSPEPT